MPTLEARSIHPAPAGRPQPIAFHDGALWVGCWDTNRLYALDPATWTVREEVTLAGQPFGLAAWRGALLVVVSLGGEEDERYIDRYVPGRGFDATERIACPDTTGSHLTTDGTSLYLVQQSYRRLLELDDAGAVRRSFALPTRCAGIAFDGTACSMIAADEEFEALELGTLELGSGDAVFHARSRIDADARGLAFDGQAWWTSYRERSEIASFAR